ncbi:MAG: hypothetical protein QOI47_1209, partial [Actinomycetota bacterium]|nr:hypothetical protein [Actinomycetota bacterium]
MRTTRLLGAAAAAALVAIAPLSATIAAAAEVHGVGTGSVSSTLLQVDVGKDGSVLSVRVLGDDGTSSIDPSKGAPSSSTSLTPLKVSSGAVPALNITSPSVSTSSTGAEDKKTVSPAIPSNPAFTGSLTANLSSIVDQVGARSGLAATLQNLSVAGGLLNVPSAKATLGTNAASVESMSTRSISIPSIEVLNLGAVLKGVGLPLDKLPLKALYDLLGGLGITLPDLSDPAKVVASVNTAIDSLKGQTGALTTAICASVDSALSPIGGIAGTNAASGAAQQVIDTVHATAPGAV